MDIIIAMPGRREAPEMLHISQSGFACRMRSDASLSQTGIEPQGRSSSTLAARTRRCVAVMTVHLRRRERVEGDSAEPVAVAIGCT